MRACASVQAAQRSACVRGGAARLWRRVRVVLRELHVEVEEAEAVGRGWRAEDEAVPVVDVVLVWLGEDDRGGLLAELAPLTH